MAKLIASLALSLAAATFAASSPAQTTAPSVTYVFDNQTLTITPTGPTTIDVAAGQTFSVAGAWSTVYNGADGDYTQLYLAGISPISGQIDLFDSASQGTAPGDYYSQGSGTYDGVFTAPLASGTYFLSGGTTPDYHFDPGVKGQPNSLDQVSYIIQVGSPTPEPSSLILLGTGALSMIGVARRRFKK